MLSKILLYIWELPQNIIGYNICRSKLHIHSFKNCDVYKTDKDDGMCMGRYTLIQPDCFDGILLRHEYGHRIQSIILGWLYIPIIFIPSLVWFKYIFDRMYPKGCLNDYYKFYTESWANKLVGKLKGIIGFIINNFCIFIKIK